jgi:hypothetical protein
MCMPIGTRYATATRYFRVNGAGVFTAGRFFRQRKQRIGRMSGMVSVKQRFARGAE